MVVVWESSERRIRRTGKQRLMLCLWGKSFNFNLTLASRECPPLEHTRLSTAVFPFATLDLCLHASMLSLFGSSSTKDRPRDS